MPPKPLADGDDDGDRCLVRTTHGKIVVGISGLDRFEEAPNAGGLFKALGRLFESQGKAFGQYVVGLTGIEVETVEPGAAITV